VAVYDSEWDEMRAEGGAALVCPYLWNLSPVLMTRL